jgi:hypothetical protein
MSKGSNRRKEDIAKIWDNWDAIFKKDKPEDKPEDKPKELPAKEDTAKENAK